MRGEARGERHRTPNDPHATPFRASAQHKPASRWSAGLLAGAIAQRKEKKNQNEPCKRLPASHTDTTPSAIPPTMRPWVKDDALPPRVDPGPHAREEKRVRVFTLQAVGVEVGGTRRRQREVRLGECFWGASKVFTFGNAPGDRVACRRRGREVHRVEREFAAIVIKPAASAFLRGIFKGGNARECECVSGRRRTLSHRFALTLVPEASTAGMCRKGDHASTAPLSLMRFRSAMAACPALRGREKK